MVRKPKSKHKAHGEAKTVNKNLRLTETGSKGVEALAQALGISVSELVDRIGRRQTPLSL